jgi:hypothetical protein
MRHHVAGSRAPELETQIVRCESEIAGLTSIVGDPEDVLDSCEWLPHDMLSWLLCDGRAAMSLLRE